VTAGPGGFKDRPALVRRCSTNADGRKAVTVAYGTSQIAKKYPGSFKIENQTDMDTAGLYQATRFDLLDTLTLPWASEFFIPPGGRTSPILGSLPANQVGRLKRLAWDLKQKGLLP
jgi:hypothetical protein